MLLFLTLLHHNHNLTSDHVIFLFLTFIFITVIGDLYYLHYGHALPLTHTRKVKKKLSLSRLVRDRMLQMPKLKKQFCKCLFELNVITVFVQVFI